MSTGFRRVFILGHEDQETFRSGLNTAKAKARILVNESTIVLSLLSRREMPYFSIQPLVSIIGLLLIFFKEASAFDNSRQDNVGYTRNLRVSAG